MRAAREQFHVFLFKTTTWNYELYGLGDCVNIRASLQLSVLTSLAHFADQLKFTSPAFNRLLLTALPLEFPSKKGEKKANTTFQYIADWLNESLCDCWEEVFFFWERERSLCSFARVRWLLMGQYPVALRYSFFLNKSLQMSTAARVNEFKEEKEGMVPGLKTLENSKRPRYFTTKYVKTTGSFADEMETNPSVSSHYYFSWCLLRYDKSNSSILKNSERS